MMPIYCRAAEKMLHRYTLTGLVMLFAAASVLAEKNAQKAPLKSAPSLEAFGITFGKPPAIPACPATIDGRFNPFVWSRRGNRTCLEVGQRKVGRGYVYRLHLGSDAATGWFPASCTYTLAVVDGEIVDISIMADETVTFDAIVSILAKHYGSQHGGRRTNSVELVDGKLTKKSLTQAVWRFSDLNVNFNGRSDVPTTGQVDLFTPAFAAWYQKYYKAKQSGNAQTKRAD